MCYQAIEFPDLHARLPWWASLIALLLLIASAALPAGTGAARPPGDREPPNAWNALAVSSSASAQR